MLFAYTLEDEGLIKIKFKAVTASSVLKESGRSPNYYAPDKALDADQNTSWCKGKKGQGIGEFISVKLKEPVALMGLRIINGYGSTIKLYKANNRVRDYRLTLYLQNGQKRIINGSLEDNACTDDHPAVPTPPGKCLDIENSGETIEFEKVYCVAAYKFEIQSVYKGEKYNDTCIADMVFYIGEGHIDLTPAQKKTMNEACR